MVIFFPSHACIFGVVTRGNDAAIVLVHSATNTERQQFTCVSRIEIIHQTIHDSFFVHMLFCKHVRLSCVISAYSLTYLLTYLNFPVRFFTGRICRDEWIELYSMSQWGGQKPAPSLFYISDMFLRFETRDTHSRVVGVKNRGQILDS